jgi:hypothetical protein
MSTLILPPLLKLPGALELTPSEGVGVPWWDDQALLDFDVGNDRVRYSSTSYSIAAFLAAHDGEQEGAGYVIAPKVIGDELLSDPGFDAGITGWASGETYERASA